MKAQLRVLSGTPNIGTADVLHASLEIYSWLESHKIAVSDGVYYETNPGGPIDYSTHPVHGPYALYSGSAGIGYFLLRLYEVTGEKQYLEETVSIVDELMAHVAGPEFYTIKLATAMDSQLKVVGWHTGIYSGPTGAGILALALHEKIQADKYVAFAKKLGDDILSVSKRTKEGLTLTGDLDIFSDGGFVLYFISLYKATGENQYLDAARDYAAFIYSKRLQGEKGGEYYYANELSYVGMPKGSIYTGFAHGTAGIGYLLAVLYEEDHKDWELDGARSVAQFIDGISDEVNGGKLTPYIYGGQNSEAYAHKYYIGFCHGPAGDAQLYRKLYQVTGEERYKKSVIACAEGIIASGAPEYNSWGLWNSYCLCCGTPGLIEFFTEVYEFTGDAKYLDLAKRSAAKTIADSSETTEGRTFYGHWDRTNHRDVQSYTGLYSGAAGAAANLLRLYAHENGKSLTPIWEYSYLDH